MSGQDASYVCGHSRHELARLEAQGTFFESITRNALAAAGLKPGMRVLDIGCGPGDVTFLVAEMVKPGGSILGIDRSSEAVSAARARRDASGLAEIDFAVCEADAVDERLGVDFVVGRFVLMHQADPARTLRAVRRHLDPGGAILMIESHVAAAADFHAYPRAPLYGMIMTWMIEVITRAGAHADMGLRLHATFVDAGLPAPEVTLHARVEGAADSPIFAYTAESVRSLLPTATRLGMPFPVPEVDVDALELRLRDEAIAHGAVLFSPIIVTAWCRS